MTFCALNIMDGLQLWRLSGASFAQVIENKLGVPTRLQKSFMNALTSCARPVLASNMQDWRV